MKSYSFNHSFNLSVPPLPGFNCPSIFCTQKKLFRPTTGLRKKYKKLSKLEKRFVYNEL